MRKPRKPRPPREPRKSRAWINPLDVPDKISDNYAEKKASAGHDLLERGIECLNCKGEGFTAVPGLLCLAKRNLGDPPSAPPIRCGSCDGKGLVMPSVAQEYKPTLPVRQPGDTSCPFTPGSFRRQDHRGYGVPS